MADFKQTSLDTMRELWGTIDELNPYIHSNYGYYYRSTKAYAIQNALSHPLADELQALKDVRNVLYREAKEVFEAYNVSTAAELWELINKDSRFTLYNAYAIRFLQTSEGTSAILSLFQIDGSMAQKELGKAITEDILDQQVLSSLTSKVIRNLIDKKGIKQTSNGSLDFSALSRGFGDFGKELKVELSNHKRLTATGKGSILYKTVRDKLMQSNFITMTTQIDKVIQRICNAVEDGLRSEGKPIEKDKMDLYASYLKANLTEKTLSLAKTKTLASGVVGEDLFVEILGQGSNTDVIISANKNETSIRKEIYERLQPEIYKDIKGIRDMSKQSYSDIVVWVKGKPIRIQSKTYAGAIDAFNKRGRTGDINQQMTVMEDINVAKFIREMYNKVEEGGIATSKEDLLELGYTVANDVWFATKGDWKTKKTYNLSTDTVNASLTSIFIDYLGVMIDEEWNVQPEQSNIFFLIDAEFLVPTYVFLDGLISILEDGENALNTVRAHITAYNPSENAEHLHDLKLNALDGAAPGFEYPPSLRAIGQNLGQEILLGSSIHININASLKDLASSSYNLLNKISNYVKSH